MRIGICTGYTELYWGNWFDAKQLGGSENLAWQLARQFALLGHETSLRLPYEGYGGPREGVNLLPLSAGSAAYDLLFAFDDFAVRDTASQTVLVACRSDPPKHVQFDQMIFLSGHHARTMGHPGRPYVGGGVHLSDYATPKERIPQRVICCSSPDRCPKAGIIGRGFDFVHSYKQVPGFHTTELDRAELIDLQQTAEVMIYPLDPSRPSDFFSMAVLEAMAAGTPVIVSDADSMTELWAGAAIVLPRPIRLSEWHYTVETILGDRAIWGTRSAVGSHWAAKYDWPLVAQRYLDTARST